ncbi:Putative regulatory protein mlp [Gryllus bimaculatus]|nr:Putative regulatory protein mlp [Gryllus bimaculatus]
MWKARLFRIRECHTVMSMLWCSVLVLSYLGMEPGVESHTSFWEGGESFRWTKFAQVNGRLVLEGALRIHWGVIGMIHLKEDDDQRTVVTIRKRNSCRSEVLNGIEVVDEQNLSENEAGNDLEAKDDREAEPDELSSSETTSVLSNETELKQRSSTLPPKLDVKQIDWDELDDLLQVERKVDDSEKLYQTMPGSLPSVSQTSGEGSDHSAPSLSAQSSVDTTESPTSEDISVRSVFSDSGVGTANRTSRSNAHDEEGDTLDQELSNMSKYPNLDKNLNRSMSGPECLERHWDHCTNDDTLKSSYLSESLREDLDHGEEVVVLRKAAKTGSTAIRRRPGKRRSRTKLKRRCSINGHFYNRETSFFTPPHGSQMSVWVTSLVNTQEVINLLLEKYKVDSKADNFALFVVRDNGVRVMLGPHEDVAKLFLMDRQNTQEISCEVAQFLNLSIAECRAILERYQDEEEREMKRVRLKFREMRKRIKQRMEDLKGTNEQLKTNITFKISFKTH